MTICIGGFTYFYTQMGKLIEQKLKAGPFATTSILYAAPRPVAVGEEASTSEIAAYLRRCGYQEATSSRIGWYRVRPDNAIEVHPGPDSYDPEGATIKTSGDKITQIISLRDNAERTQFFLEPELITNLFDHKREKRRIVKYEDIPEVMKNALFAAEDKHFRTHSGVDPIGMLRAIWFDLRQQGTTQGASTITQQLADTFWLSDQKRGFKRKLEKSLMAIYLEQHYTKNQILEYYSNAIYLGHAGSFSINGFGEGAQVYFGKDLKQITLPEAATLAGLINSPDRRNPYRAPESAKTRRNVVLKAMREDGFITERQYIDAVASPFHVTRDTNDSLDAPYFVDLVNDTLQSKFQDRDFQTHSYRVYTTLDMNLQHDAVAAVREGIKETDEQWHRRSKKYGTEELPLAQVALICLDAETGEVKALVGGRNYGVSQLDHALAKRQPGSSFKPFVYAAAFTQSLNGDGAVLTPASTVEDEPTTFWYDNSQPPYEPHNHGNTYNGTVTLRTALAKSLNIPAVKVAEMVGYDKVAKTARLVGLNAAIRPTPSIALGSYEVTPLEVAGAYTVFTNGGDVVKTSFIKGIRDQQGTAIFDAQPERKHALDPRVAYLVENMMEEVLRSGTGGGVWAKGLPNIPVAGKTGTSNDGWFAGFTSRLICVVWVGFDDNRDFKLEGARSALPIWVEFMKSAYKHREYRNVHAFGAPDGIVTAEIDPETGQLATANCPKIRSEVFLAGTQPVQTCKLHGGGTQVADWNSDPNANNGLKNVADPKKSSDPKPKGKGFFGHVRDIFKP